MNLLRRLALRLRERAVKPTDAASMQSHAWGMSNLAMPAPTGEHQLSRLALRWMASLPNSVRPTELGRAHPRLVNQLSLCWKDHALTTRVLTGLVVDRRGNRKGFPKAIVVELLGLQEFHARRAVGEEDELWADSTLAVTDR